VSVSGVNHLTLSIRDVAQSITFYTEVLGCRLLARWPKGAYLLAGDMWIALVLDEKLRLAPLPEYSHIAFSVSAEALGIIRARLTACGAVIWQENKTEGDSVYFLDPNGHKLEIHASDLAARLQSARANPWAGLEIVDSGG